MRNLRLLTAGPVDVDDEILEALARPTLPHYGPHWRPIYEETLAQAKRLFQTQGDVLLIPGPGSGALDAGIGSLVSPYSGICTPVNGFFGERVHQIIEAYGIDSYRIDFPPGAPIDPDEVRRKLEGWMSEAFQKGRPIRGLAIVHHETSTGVLNPLEELARVAREFGLIMIVDAVASMGGVPLPVDEWGIDLCVTVPNKCLGAPPGVALLSVSQEGWALSDHNPARHGWYHDLRTWAWFREHEREWHPYPTTLPTNVIAALNAALRHVFETGLENHMARIRDTAMYIREGMDEFGFKLFPDPAHAAPVLSAFHALPGMNVSEMMRYLRDERGLMISGGLGDLAGKIFRIGHMGGASHPEVAKAVLDGIGAYLDSKQEDKRP